MSAATQTFYKEFNILFQPEGGGKEKASITSFFFKLIRAFLWKIFVK
jgi:hypothetical protein